MNIGDLLKALEQSRIPQPQSYNGYPNGNGHYSLPVYQPLHSTPQRHGGQGHGGQGHGGQGHGGQGGGQGLVASLAIRSLARQIQIEQETFESKRAQERLELIQSQETRAAANEILNLPGNLELDWKEVVDFDRDTYTQLSRMESIAQSRLSLHSSVFFETKDLSSLAVQGWALACLVNIE